MCLPPTKNRFLYKLEGTLNEKFSNQLPFENKLKSKNVPEPKYVQGVAKGYEGKNNFGG
jgi:hypothetical protein